MHDPTWTVLRGLSSTLGIWSHAVSKNETLRFPTGITVAQAKKDAKALAKSQTFTLSEALDMVARRNGIDKPWSKAVAWLADNDDRIASFKLPLPTCRSHIVDVPNYAPLVVIAGQAGCGKSILAVELARQHLSNNPSARLDWMSPIGLRSIEATDASRSRCMPEHMLEALDIRHPGRVQFSEFDPESHFPGENAPAGSMVVIDDASLFPLLDSHLPKWISAALERRIVLVVCVQHLLDLIPKSVPEGLGLFLIGRARSMPNPLREYPGIAQWDQAISDLPSYGDFLVAPAIGHWADLIRLPTPKF